MKTLEQMKAEHAAQLAKLEHEHMIRGLMPAAPEPTLVIRQDSSTWVNYRFPKLRDAVAFAESLQGDIVPGQQFKGVYSHWAPQQAFSRDAATDWKAPAREPMECIAELELNSFRFSNDNPFHSRAELSFWLIRAGHVIKVQCAIGATAYAPPYYLRMQPKHKHTRESDVVLWTAPDAVRSIHGREVRFAAGSGPGKGVDARFYYQDFESLHLLCDEMGD